MPLLLPAASAARTRNEWRLPFPLPALRNTVTGEVHGSNELSSTRQLKIAAGSSDSKTNFARLRGLLVRSIDFGACEIVTMGAIVSGGA